MSSSNQQFSKYPNSIKAWRRHLSLSQWGVLSIIHEKLTDWDKESDAISVSQIMAECTASRSAIKELLAGMRSESGPLEVVSRDTRGIPVYRIRICPSTGSESDLVDAPTGSESGPKTDCKPLLSLYTLEEEQKMNLAPSSKSQETGIVLSTEQEVDHLAYEQKITKKQAAGILKDGNGMSVATILAILKKSRENIDRSENRIGYMRGIIKKLAPGRKANHPAKPMSKPLPSSAGPLPIGRELAAVDENYEPF